MRKNWFWVVFLLLICGLLYTSGLDYGRPLPEYNPSTVQNGWLNEATVFHPDAYDYASRPYSMLLRGTSPLKPNFYHNPSLTIELNMLLSWLSNATSMYSGSIDPHAPLPAGTKLNCETGEPPNPVCLRQITPFSVYAAARYLSALMAVLAVSVVYAGGRLVFNRQVGLVAAVLVGLCPMVAQIAHYENSGATTLAVSSAALFMCLLLIKWRSTSAKLYIVGGLMVGLAGAARYNAGVVGVVFVVACIFNWWHSRKIAPFALGMAAIPVGFLIGTPGAVFEFRVFFEDVRYILFWYGSVGGGPGWTSGGALQSVLYNWRYMFLIVAGPIAAISGIWGLSRLFKHRRGDNESFWMGIALLAYLVFYTFFALSSKRLNANLLIPMITPVALIAAYGFSMLPVSVVRTRGIKIALAVVLTAWPVFLAVYLAGMFLRPDSRMLAQDWIYQHVPRDTPVHLLGSYNVPLDPLDYHSARTDGASAPLNDPLWDSPVIVYSDSYSRTVLRDVNLTQNPADIQATEAMIERLENDWIELARFPRTYWFGQDLAPDDVSFWHQMEIVVYCNPATCPVKQN